MTNQHPVTRRRHRRTVWRWVVGLLAMAVVSVGMVLAWITLHPRTNPADRVDALVVLATRYGAHDEARRLAEAGATDLLLVSSPPGHEFTLCQADDLPAHVEVECFTPEPSTTQGEAMVGTELARAHDAETLGVMTFDHHVERSRMVFDRCWDQSLYMYEFPTERGLSAQAYDFVYAMAAYGKALVIPGCDTQPPDWMQDPIEWVKRVG